MGNDRKQGINIKYKVILRRIVIWVGEITIILLFVAVALFLLFVAIAEIVAWLKVGSFFNLFNGWDLLRENEKDFTGVLSQDVATIFVAAASILVAVSTIVQAHFTRVHDRVSNFPQNCFSWISISTNLGKDLKRVRKYFQYINGENFIEFNIREGFSTCYKANPYRMFIFWIQDNDEKKADWEELRIYQSRCISLHDSDVNSYEMLIDCDKSDLLKKYCELPPKNERYNLKIFLDIEWINQLVPKWWRWFVNIYIREEIFLEGSFEKNHLQSTNSKRKDKLGLFENHHQIMYIDHYRAPLMPHIKRSKKE